MSNDKVTILTQKSVIVVAPNSALPGGGGVSDHGALTGLADDDHTQYALADGSRGPAHGQLTGLDADDHTQYALTDGSRGSFATAAQGLLADSAVQPTIVDVKGDLVVATAADTLARLAVGADTLVLTADSAEATGLKWAAAGGGGGDLVDDTTPQLGGNLDLNTFSVIGAGVSISPTVIQLASTGSYQFSSGAVGAASDVILARDGANTLAQTNGTNAQSFNIYQTYIDPSNYSRMSIGYGAIPGVVHEKIGTGAFENLFFGAISGTSRNGMVSGYQSNTIYFYKNSSVPFARIVTGYFEITSTTAFAWSPNSDPRSAPDTLILRDAANTIAMRNGTAAQAFNIYNTYTDASNYERLAIKCVLNVATIAAENSGTGVQMDIVLSGANRANNIANVSSGTDTAYETAINAILAALESHGIVAAA